MTAVEEAITRVVERATPSVASVATVEVGRDPWRRPAPVAGMGSAVVVSADGYLITNFHVVRRARGAEVLLADGRRLEAEFVGGDPGFDLAVLKVEAKDLVPISFGDADGLRVGQFAIAIGSPFGLMLRGPSVTVGVVSALGRTLDAPNGPIEDLIQTDAPINPGNSGGPLLNTDGELIGINTAIIPYAQGIGFAIPVSVVRDVVDQVLRYGRVVRPWLGIAGVTVTREVAGQFGLRPDAGVLVVRVEPDSPADQAGLAAGDVITKVDAAPLSRIEELRRYVAAQKPDQELQVTVARKGRTLRSRIQLRERNPPQA